MPIEVYASLKQLKEFKFQTVLVGTSNSGKSTFINNSTGMHVCNINTVNPYTVTGTGKTMDEYCRWVITFSEEFNEIEIQKIFVTQEISNE